MSTGATRSACCRWPSRPTSPLDLFHVIRYEAHPVLWYLLIYLGDSILQSPLMLGRCWWCSVTPASGRNRRGRPGCFTANGSPGTPPNGRSSSRSFTRVAEFWDAYSDENYTVYAVK